MKKFIYSFIAIAGVLAAASCQKEELTVYDPESATSPTLTAPAGGTLAIDGAPIVLSFTEADFGFTASSTYSLTASLASDMSAAVKVSASIATGETCTATITQSSMNSAILNLGGEADTPVTVYFMLTAAMANQQSAAISGTELNSEVVSAVFTPYSADLLDTDLYDYIWVLGGFNSWSHDDAQYMFNYSGDGAVYEGMIDFGTAAGSGWKITGIAGWDDSCNWGTNGDAEAPADEASSVQLISSGGSGNISCYSAHRFYKFKFDRTSLVLTMEWGLDEVGVIGLNDDWTTGVPMEYNVSRNRFFADVTAESATTFKFWVDNAWTLNWGGDPEKMSANGENMPIEAGNYRIYFYPNNLRCEISERMYGQEEPGYEAPGEVTEPQVWSVVGLGGDWNTDIDMTEGETGVWSVTGVSISSTDEFKLRFAHDWVVTSVGGPEANATSIIDETNPYEVFQPTLGEAFATGGYNIWIGADGTYDIVYDSNAGTVTITPSTWSIIGSIYSSNWGVDYDMTSTDNVVYTYNGLTVTADDQFKLRFAHKWGDDVGGTEANLDNGCYQPTLGEAFATGAANIQIGTAGTYNVVYDTAAGTITISAAE